MSEFPLNLVTIEVPLDAPAKVVDDGGLHKWVVYAALANILADMEREEEASELALAPNEQEDDP